MSRSNEYKVTGGAFADPNEAINALDSLLEDVKRTDAKSSFNIEQERQYRANITELQGCFDKIFSEAKQDWKDIGLDGAFSLVSDDVSPDKFKRQALFQHPIYEHVWLTDPSGKNMSEELHPFLRFSMEYDKSKSTVAVSFTKVETKLNLPELRTSIKSVRDDLELVKQEVERVGTVVNTALDVVTRITSGVRELCNANQLKLNLNEDGGSAESFVEETPASDDEDPDSSLAAEKKTTEDVAASAEEEATEGTTSEEITSSEIVSEEEIASPAEDDAEASEETIAADTDEQNSDSASTPPPLKYLGFRGGKKKTAPPLPFGKKRR
ncbi:MAG: hypothetical protein QNJ97_14405 [Myxococcota bacterium]|nr:hypothetical protein [Myxococcota bacterium]